jgi:hypothetical protein
MVHPSWEQWQLTNATTLLCFLSDQHIIVSTPSVDIRMARSRKRDPYRTHTGAVMEGTGRRWTLPPLQAPQYGTCQDLLDFFVMSVPLGASPLGSRLNHQVGSHRSGNGCVITSRGQGSLPSCTMGGHQITWASCIGQFRPQDLFS